MVYKPTGRPPGRPKTKEYVTLMARVPQEFADQAKAYAHRRQQPLSVVLRDGLALLLTSERQESTQNMSDRNTGIVSDTNIDTQGARPLAPEHAPPQPAPPALDYDPTTYFLGKICKHTHDYQGTGQSLRRVTGSECLECQAARQRNRRQRQADKAGKA